MQLRAGIEPTTFRYSTPDTIPTRPSQSYLIYISVHGIDTGPDRKRKHKTSFCVASILKPCFLRHQVFEVEGVLAPVFTPFMESGSMDLSIIPIYMAHLNKHQVNGILGKSKAGHTRTA